MVKSEVLSAKRRSFTKSEDSTASKDEKESLKIIRHSCGWLLTFQSLNLSKDGSMTICSAFKIVKPLLISTLNKIAHKSRCILDLYLNSGQNQGKIIEVVHTYLFQLCKYSLEV